jgi:hypothetical protein
MSPKQILSKLCKLLGEHAAYKFDPKAPDADERKAARELIPGARLQWESYRDARKERADYLLANDDEYQRLKAAEKTARESYDKVSSVTHKYKCTAGTSSSMFFHVKAQGDTWAEVFAKLEGES